VQAKPSKNKPKKKWKPKHTLAGRRKLREIQSNLIWNWFKGDNCYTCRDCGRVFHRNEDGMPHAGDGVAITECPNALDYTQPGHSGQLSNRQQAATIMYLAEQAK